MRCRPSKKRAVPCGTGDAHFPACQALIAGLVSLNFVKQFTQPLASFVQLLIFLITYRASNYLGNLVVLVPLDIVQNEYCAVASGNCSMQRSTYVAHRSREH